jgi:hypothetical protein
MTIHPPEAPFRPISLLGALILPGLGHVLGGDPLRGACVALGVLGLFFGGILVGGIDVIDSREDRVWFYGQALVGPIAFGADYLHQSRLKVIDPQTGRLRTAYPNEGRNPRTRMAEPGGTPPNTKSVAKMNELGTLAATLAGFLNLIAIIDAGFPLRRRTTHSSSSPSPQSPRTGP